MCVFVDCLSIKFGELKTANLLMLGKNKTVFEIN